MYCNRTARTNDQKSIILGSESGGNRLGGKRFAVGRVQLDFAVDNVALDFLDFADDVGTERLVAGRIPHTAGLHVQYDDLGFVGTVLNGLEGIFRGRLNLLEHGGQYGGFSVRIYSFLILVGIDTDGPYVASLAAVFLGLGDGTVTGSAGR